MKTKTRLFGVLFAGAIGMTALGCQREEPEEMYEEEEGVLQEDVEPGMQGEEGLFEGQQEQEIAE